jgi:hypothetical protein
MEDACAGESSSSVRGGQLAHVIEIEVKVEQSTSGLFGFTEN